MRKVQMFKQIFERDALGEDIHAVMYVSGRGGRMVGLTFVNDLLHTLLLTGPEMALRQWCTRMRPDGLVAQGWA